MKRSRSTSVPCGKYAEAEPLFRRALDNLFQQFQYNFTYMTEQERLGFLHTVFDYFPVYFTFVHLYHEKHPQLTGSMYNLLLWDKSLIVGSVAGMRRQVEASGDMEALKLLGQLECQTNADCRCAECPAAGPRPLAQTGGSPGLQSAERSFRTFFGTIFAADYSGICASPGLQSGKERFSAP